MNEIIAEWGVFKKEFQKELDAFNNRAGKYNRRDLLEEVKKIENHRDVPRPHEYLAVVYLINAIVNNKFNKMLDEYALEKGWINSVQWNQLETDEDKFKTITLINGEQASDFSDYIPFSYDNDKSVTIPKTIPVVSRAGCPLICIDRDDRDRFKAGFNDDSDVIVEIRQIEYQLRH